jgi:hypothetical protein
MSDTDEDSELTETQADSFVCCTLVEEVRLRLEGDGDGEEEEVEQPLIRRLAEQRDTNPCPRTATWKAFLQQRFREEKEELGEYEAGKRREAREMARRLYEEGGEQSEKENSADTSSGGGTPSSDDGSGGSPWPRIADRVLRWLEEEDPHWTLDRVSPSASSIRNADQICCIVSTVMSSLLTSSLTLDMQPPPTGNRPQEVGRVDDRPPRHAPAPRHHPRRPRPLRRPVAG